MTDEEKAEEYSDNLDLVKERNPKLKTNDDFIKQAYLDGLKEGRKEAEKQWHDCFLTCSSPYCAKHFPAIKMEGELGNMSKRERE